MTNLNNFSIRLSRAKASAFLLCLAALAGFADCAYLFMQETAGKGYRCDVRGFDCGYVLQSRFSTFLGIPWTVWGLAYYAALFVVVVALLASGKRILMQILGLFVVSGLLVSISLLYIQGAVLHAWCLYCVVSESAVGVLALGYALAQRNHHG